MTKIPAKNEWPKLEWPDPMVILSRSFFRLRRLNYFSPIYCNLISINFRVHQSDFSELGNNLEKVFFPEIASHFKQCGPTYGL